MDPSHDREIINRLKLSTRAFIASYPAEYNDRMIAVYSAMCQFELYHLNQLLAEDKCLADELGYLIWEYNEVVGYEGNMLDPDFCGLVRLAYWFKPDVNWINAEDRENRKYVLKLVDPAIYDMHCRVSARESCEMMHQLKI